MKKHLRTLMAAALAAVMTFSTACGSQASPAPADNVPATKTETPATQTETPAAEVPAGVTELVICVGPNPDTIDPALNSAVDGGTLLLHAFEGLYTLNRDGAPIPGQAEGVEISEDGTVYTFTLRDNLSWSDGTPLTAEDFVYSWKRAADPETAADYEYMFDCIVGYDEGDLAVEAIDEKTLEVTLISRIPYFLELTAFPTFYPVQKATVEANGDAWATKVSSYISNGPYTMSEWVSNSHITYVKNEGYWNYDALGPDSIKFILMDDDNAILAGYKSGTLKFIDSVPNDEIPALKKQDDFYIMGQLGTYYISYNVTVPPMDNPRFRQALTLAVDRDYITANIGLAGQINAGAYVPIGISDADPAVEFRTVGGDYYDPSPEGYAANLEEAKAIIAELYPDGDVPTIEYIYNVGTGHQLIAQALQQMWKEIGVDSTLSVQEWATFLNTRKNGEYQVARNGWLMDYNDPIGMLDMWITGGGNNDAQWSNEEYDALIKAVKASPDQEERMKLMHEAEDIIFDEWMLCPIYYYVDLFMIDDSLDGFYTTPLGFKYFMYVTQQ